MKYRSQYCILIWTQYQHFLVISSILMKQIYVSSTKLCHVKRTAPNAIILFCIIIMAVSVEKYYRKNCRERKLSIYNIHMFIYGSCFLFWQSGQSQSAYWLWRFWHLDKNIFFWLGYSHKTWFVEWLVLKILKINKSQWTFFSHIKIELDILSICISYSINDFNEGKLKIIYWK